MLSSEVALVIALLSFPIALLKQGAELPQHPAPKRICKK